MRPWSALVVLVTGALVATLVHEALPALVPRALPELWGMAFSPPDRFGALGPLTGSVAVAALALALAGPVGVGAGIYLGSLAQGTWARLLSGAIDTLTGVPAVVVGFLATSFLLPVLRVVAPAGGGYGLLPAAVALGVMVVPTVEGFAADAMRAVPADLVAGSLALGATLEASVLGVGVAHARRGLSQAVLLGTGRALGEGMAVEMLVGNAPHPPALLAPSQTLTSVLVQQFGLAQPRSLWAHALAVLGILVLALAAGVSALGARRA